MKISLKAARVNAGLRQTDVAEKIGVCHATLSVWESGRGIPPVTKFIELCKLYGVSAQDISVIGEEQ